MMTQQRPALALLLFCACLSACLDAAELDTAELDTIELDNVDLDPRWNCW